MLNFRKICAVDVMKAYFGAFLAFQERKPGDEAISSDFHPYPPQHFCMRKNNGRTWCFTAAGDDDSELRGVLVSVQEDSFVIGKISAVNPSTSLKYS